MCASERDGQRAQARAMLTFDFAFTSAPFASSASTTSKWPLEQAAMSGVSPFCGAGEHHGQRLPPPSSWGPPACPHQLTPRVGHRAGLFRPPFTRPASHQPLALRDRARCIRRVPPQQSQHTDPFSLSYNNFVISINSSIIYLYIYICIYIICMSVYIYPSERVSPPAHTYTRLNAV
jgi:hypothetical protein